MKRLKKLHLKLTVLYTCFAVLLGVFISVFGYRIMWNLATSFYNEKARQAASLAATWVDGDHIRDYLETGVTDEAYDELQVALNTMKEELNLTYLYVYVPGSDHLTYIIEARTEQDDPMYISSLGDTYAYTELELTYLLPDVEAKRGSQEVVLSTHESLFGNAVDAWAPVLDSRGDLAVMVEADISLDLVSASIRNSILLMLGVYVVMIGVMILFQGISIRRMVTIPLYKLTDRTLRFAAEGELSGPEDDIRTGDELQTLSEAFGQMAGDIRNHMKERAELAAAKERIATELEVATDIQRSLLPGALEHFPGEKYLDIQGQLLPSPKMGGSFYDYFPLNDHQVGLVICDMNSTGISAAMLLVVIRTIIKSQFSGERPLPDTMGEINHQIFDFMDAKSPISAFVGVLDTREGVLTYINAGYDPPVMMRRGERYELLASAASVPLGTERNVNYRELRQELRQGDRLLFYSDGVVGARGLEGEPFGVERLRTCLNEARGAASGPGALIDSVVAAVTEFTERTTPEDDLVLLALEYRRGNRDRARLTLPPDMDRVRELQEFLREQMAVNGITGKHYAQILVCGEELFSICCKYAAGNRVEAECAVSGGNRLELRLFADFQGADPLSEEAGDVVQNAAAFIRGYAERLTLEELGGQTALVMVKTIAQEQPALAAAL